MGAGPLGDRREPDVETAAAGQQRQQRAVHPVDGGTVVLAGTVEAGAVLPQAGGEQVVADQAAERVQQRERPREAGQRPVADVHPDVTGLAQQRAQHLTGHAGGEPVAVQALQRYVALRLP